MRTDTRPCSAKSPMVNMAAPSTRPHTVRGSSVVIVRIGTDHRRRVGHAPPPDKRVFPGRPGAASIAARCDAEHALVRLIHGGPIAKAPLGRTASATTKGRRRWLLESSHIGTA